MLAYFGFSSAPAAHGGVFMSGCLPVIPAAVTWIWLRQRALSFQVFEYAIIFAEVILIYLESVASSNGGRTWLGDALSLTATSTFAVFMVATKVWNISPAQIVFAATFTGGLLYAPTWLLCLDSNLISVPASEILLQGAYQGLVPSGLGISLL